MLVASLQASDSSARDQIAEKSFLSGAPRHAADSAPPPPVHHDPAVVGPAVLKTPPSSSPTDI